MIVDFLLDRVEQGKREIGRDIILVIAHYSSEEVFYEINVKILIRYLCFLGLYEISV